MINKVDQPGADRVEQQLEALLTTTPGDHAAPSIVRTVATENQGIDDWLAALRSRTRSDADAHVYWRERLLALLRQRLLEHITSKVLSEEELDNAARKVARHEQNPYDLVEEVLRKAGLS